MKKKIVFLSVFLCIMQIQAYGQLTLETCYERAQLNYPQAKAYGLINQSEGYNLRNASRGYLPQFSMTAKATYQTEVTKVPLTLPDVTIPTLNKDQYQAVAEVNQVIWDGGVIKSQKEMIEAKHETERKQYEVDMYTLNERVNELFFGILLLDEQLILNDIYAKELEVNSRKVSSWIENGTANQADLDAVKVELLNVSQNRTELAAIREAYSDMLACFIGEEPGTDIQLVKPEVSLFPEYRNWFSAEGERLWDTRPEMGFYEANIKQLESQRKSITSNNLPKLSAFVQGGYGNPGLNMLRDEFRPFAIGGIRLSWNFGGLYTRKDDLRKIENHIGRVHVQQEIFDFNTRLRIVRQQTELNKYLKITEDDEQIIRLRENIRRASEAKVENGTMSVNDLVRDISAVQTARQNKTLHEIEILKSIYQIKYTLNR